MDGVHDLGGTDGVGQIKREEDEPYFHEEWEEDIFALLPLTMGQGMYNIDEFRHAIERMDPAHYLGSSYYEHWLSAMETLLVEKGVLSEEELDERLEQIQTADDPEALIPEREDPELTEEMLNLIDTGASAMRDSIGPTFGAGDQVRVKNMHPEGHTRCPEYVRRAQGEIADVRGTFVLPDTHAHGEGESPETVYSVRFDTKELWGDEYAGDNEVLHIDLWESYLEAA
ncbi:MAG: nitrile hydratase subunit beta [Halobacteriota archaeon]|uniref:nitrile hydratase subunit beta n=1 Tax=Natronomonas sp. TaxID=2184060 RepID=UPI003975831F